MARDALGGRILIVACNLISVVLVTRFAGPSVFGIYATATAFSTMLLLLTDLGSATVVVRDGIKSGRPYATARIYLQVRIVLMFTAVALGAALTTVAFPAQAQPAAWVSLGLLVFSGASVIAPLGQLGGSMAAFRRSSALQAASTLVFVGVVLVAAKPPDPALLVGANVAAAALATLYAGWSERRWMAGVFSHIDLKAIRGMFKSIAFIGLAMAVSAMYARIDGILLINISGAREAGIYAAAYRFLDQTGLLVAAAMAPIAPMVAAEIHSHTRISRPLDSVFARLELVAGVGLAWAAIAAAPLTIATVIGQDFTESGQIAALLATYRAWAFAAYLATYKLMNANRERVFMTIAAVGLAFNVAANLVLIPAHGAWGAAVATVLTELITVTLLIVTSRRESSVRRQWRIVLMVLASAASLGITLGLTTVSALAGGAASIVILAAGLGLLWRAAGIMRDDLRQVAPSLGTA